MAGQSIEYPSNGNTATGYLSLPETGSGPGVIVIQEWWGLVPHIEDVADRFAAEGYVALAPDLYHGQSTTEPDEAQKYMMELRMDEAVRDMTGAVGFLRNHEAVDPSKIGCVGFCMGGGLTLYLASTGQIAAAAPFYGVPIILSPDDWGQTACPILGHYAEHDGATDMRCPTCKPVSKPPASKLRSTSTRGRTTPSSMTIGLRSTMSRRRNWHGRGRWSFSRTTCAESRRF